MRHVLLVMTLLASIGTVGTVGTAEERKEFLPLPVDMNKALHQIFNVEALGGCPPAAGAQPSGLPGKAECCFYSYDTVPPNYEMLTGPDAGCAIKQGEIFYHYFCQANPCVPLQSNALKTCARKYQECTIGCQTNHPAGEAREDCIYECGLARAECFEDINASEGTFYRPYCEHMGYL